MASEGVAAAGAAPRGASQPTASASPTSTPQAAAHDVVLQYVVLRRDLWTEQAWPLGSVVAQGCHATTAALWLSRDSPITQQYCAPDNLDHMHKASSSVCR